MNRDIVLLFDLDDTLILEEESAQAAFLEASKTLTEYDIAPEEFATTVRQKAREIWRSLPTHPYCRQIQISSWEGLWAEFLGDHASLRKLRSLKDKYRFQSWNAAPDVRGANEAGITSIWINRTGAVNESECTPDYEVRSLKEVPGIVSTL